MTKPRRPKTGFDRYFDEQMKEPGFAAGFRAARAELGATDRLVRSLEAARLSAGLSKTELARKMGLSSSVIQRLLKTGVRSASLEPMVEVATALGAYLELVPRKPTIATRKGRRSTNPSRPRRTR